jgi:ubiquitin-protein ligase
MSATKRISADILEISKPLYAESGIYYVAEDENIQKGYACVFGPKDSPYEDCPMLYEFTFPHTFPFDNPQVQFRTYDGKTRFHPNMYVDGKCCLSILGTWSGPKWASTMRISTVLVTLQSLMDSDPIRHEPGYANPTTQMAKEYRDRVEYACIVYTLERAETLPQKQPVPFQPFQEIFRERLPGILERLESRLQHFVVTGERTFQGLAYQMGGTTQYKGLLERVLKLKAALNNSVE